MRFCVSIRAERDNRDNGRGRPNELVDRRFKFLENIRTHFEAGNTECLGVGEFERGIEYTPKDHSRDSRAGTPERQTDFLEQPLHLSSGCSLSHRRS